VFAFMCLEGLLLEHSRTESLMAQLTEAVAYRLGGTPSERNQLRKVVERAYKQRSAYVHTGIMGPGAADPSIRDYAAAVLRRELYGSVQESPERTG
jgi:hypothetical protein